MAEDCLLPGFYEGLLLRKLTLKLEWSAAIADPQRTLDEINSTLENGSLELFM